MVQCNMWWEAWLTKGFVMSIWHTVKPVMMGYSLIMLVHTLNSEWSLLITANMYDIAFDQSCFHCQIYVMRGRLHCRDTSLCMSSHQMVYHCLLYSHWRELNWSWLNYLVFSKIPDITLKWNDGVLGLFCAHCLG